MYFGMRDVLVSDFNPKHQLSYKLKMELEQKQAELEKAQAERAAREAAEAEKIKTLRKISGKIARSWRYNDRRFCNGRFKFRKYGVK